MPPARTPAGADGAPGSAAARGAPHGTDGTDGTNGILAIYTAKPIASIVAVGAGETKTTTATCAANYVAIGGGYTLDQPSAASIPYVYKSGFGTMYDAGLGMFLNWEVKAKNAGTGSFNMTPYVVCAKLATPAP